MHAGDVLTESGKRHVVRSAGGAVVEVRAEGVELFERFSRWFGAQPHAHKLLVAGNHDLVLAGMGADRVRARVHADSNGSAVYLEHETATLGPLRVFGSPQANWGSRNDAFKTAAVDYSVAEPNTHLVVTHSPCVLPDRRGQSEDGQLAALLHHTGARLHVSGHCHWAHGLYATSGGVPCVVASICDSEWLMGSRLHAGPVLPARGDPTDARYGGYNLYFPPLVCDIALPNGERPQPTDAWRTAWTAANVPAPASPPPPPVAVPEARPLALFFGPDNDPGAVERLVPRLAAHFTVHHFRRAQQAAASALAQQPGYSLCVAKLGTRGNLGADVLAALRASAHSSACPVLIHSSTAAADPQLQQALAEHFGVAAFTSTGTEEAVMAALAAQLHAGGSVESAVAAAAGAAARVAAPPPAPVPGRPVLLFFAPRNDPGVAARLTPRLQPRYDVLVFENAADAIKDLQNNSCLPLAACVCKLGTAGNLGTAVMQAVRAAAPTVPIFVHSHTAMQNARMQQSLRADFNVAGFFDSASEAALLQALA